MFGSSSSGRPLDLPQLGVVGGDAERGLLQPLVVRPTGARRCSCQPLSRRRWRRGSVFVVFGGSRSSTRPAQLASGSRSGRRSNYAGRRTRSWLAVSLLRLLVVPLVDREWDRGLHALRRRSRGRATRLDRSRAQLAHDRAHLDDRRGRCRSRGSTVSRDGALDRRDRPTFLLESPRRVRARLADPRLGRGLPRHSLRRFCEGS